MFIHLLLNKKAQKVTNMLKKHKTVRKMLYAISYKRSVQCKKQGQSKDSLAKTKAKDAALAINEDFRSNEQNVILTP